MRQIPGARLAGYLEQRTGLWLFVNGHTTRFATGVAWDGDRTGWILSGGVARFELGIGWLNKKRRHLPDEPRTRDLLAWIDAHLDGVQLTPWQRELLVRALPLAGLR